MATKKTADLSGLVATKGSAAPVADMPTRAMPPKEAAAEANNVPLNFRVSGDFRRRFRSFAANHDLKLSELLRLAFDEYEQRHKS
ncbi:TPA: hypothetical protein R4S57_004838 [Escherichia coli]|uniref:Uncharacterized protein n=1 Tax=Salmonella enterica TaxID=28901 RepID=A0A5T3SN94_SALER|nr:hypothetical protein [Salmonella enterica]EBT5577559.1 hypothetical protein [Salmonella enterica]HED1613590.1 hypothetical protein [Escherichia coli]